MVDIKELIKQGKTEEQIREIMNEEISKVYEEEAAQRAKDLELEARINDAAHALESVFTFVNPDVKVTGLDSWIKVLAKKAQKWNTFPQEWFNNDLFNLFF